MMKLKMIKIGLLSLALCFTALPEYAQSSSSSTPSSEDIRDGVVNVINPSQIADLLVWARNSRTDLEDGLARIAELPRKQRHEALRELISGVINSSGDLHTELLMRSVLRRARNLDQIVSVGTSAPEAQTLSLRIMEDSARWAIELYNSDEEFLERASQAKSKSRPIPVDLDFVGLGIQHGRYVLENVWLSPNLETRAALIKESISYFYNDLNRDHIGRRNTTIANVLMKVANFATKQGLDKSTSEYLADFRNLSVLQKQNLNRSVEAFYKEQLDRASGAQINRMSTITGIDGFSKDLVLNARFITVYPGRFLMGSPSTELNRHNDEKQHEVILTRTFAIQESEVTQAQWFEIMGDNPSRFKDPSQCADHRIVNGTPMCPNNPVEFVSWNDTQLFIDRLNSKVGRKLYRLPTEAEWEYVARGGSTSAYSFGEGRALLTDYAWFSDNSGRQSRQVCTKKPNPFGLCDMHGNVWEWVQDYWNADYPSGSVTDPLGSNGSYRVLRGGSWYSGAPSLRSASRFSSVWLRVTSASGIWWGVTSDRGADVGFRLVKTRP